MTAFQGDWLHHLNPAKTKLNKGDPGKMVIRNVSASEGQKGSPFCYLLGL